MVSIAKFLLKPYATNLLRICSRAKSKSSKSAVECKVAVITGGTVGIGYSYAKALLGCGAKAVILGDILCEKGEEAVCRLNEKYGKNKACFIKTDVTCKEEMENLFKSAKRAHKGIDIVINNAGILNDKCWELTIDINVTGLVRGTLLGFEHMRKDKGGKGGVIVNVASIYGLQQAEGCPVYSATKHFIIGFDRALSHEHYECLTQVKVLTQCPGVTDTYMVREAAKGGLEGFGDVGKLLKEGLASLPPQPSDACGECLIEMLNDGENGGIWVIEGCECYKVKLPDRESLRC